MKRFLIVGFAAAAVACSENPNQPETAGLRAPNLTVLSPAGINLLKCFTGDGTGTEPAGSCTTTADHKKATLANTSSDPDGDVSGVYSDDLTVYGEMLTNITELSYTYKSLNVPAILPTPGVLIYEIPIDTNNDALLDFWAFIDASTCGGKTGTTVNIVKMDKCAIVDGSPALHAQPYPNWAAFVADYPSARVTNLHEYIMIISARVPPAGANSWLISNVKFGKTGLICIDERFTILYGGTCTLGDDFKSATLANTSNDPDGDITFVYSRETTGAGLFLSNIKDLWYKYSGPVPTAPRDLRYIIPIDTNGDGTMEFSVEASALGCRGTPNASATVYTVNITRDAACQISDGFNTWSNWAAFAAAYPNAKTAIPDFDQLFIFAVSAERPSAAPSATWQILDVKWGAKK